MMSRCFGVLVLGVGLAAAGVAFAGKPPLALSIDKRALECPEARCTGKIDYRGGVVFTAIDRKAKVRYGDDDRLVPLPDGQDVAVRPSLGRSFAGVPLAWLTESPLGKGRDEAPLLVRLEIAFPDGVLATGSMALSRSAVYFAFADAMLAVTKGPVALPGDTPHAGPPRGMWIDFPVGTRGTVGQLGELDWVLLIDHVSRDVPCKVTSTRTGKLVAFVGSASDMRARVYERRTGKLVGERKLAEPGALSCAQQLELRETDTSAASAGDQGLATALADWAWNELRLAPAAPKPAAPKPAAPEPAAPKR